VKEALATLNNRVLVILREAVNKETLSRSDIITSQPPV